MKNLNHKPGSVGKPQFELTESGRYRLLKRYGQRPASLGRNHHLRYLYGERLSRKEAILAKCFECDRFHMDGHQTCPMPACPLHPFSQ